MHSQLQYWLTLRQKTPCHRQLLVVSGTQKWATEIATAHFSNSIEQNILWVGGGNDIHSKNLNLKDYKSQLGNEYDYLILNAFDGFRANAAMALSGTVKSNGLMILLCPSLEEWPSYDDPEHLNRISFGFHSAEFSSNFYQYLSQAFTNDNSVALLTEQRFVSPLFELSATTPEKTYQQQSLAISAICKVANGHNNRPLVLTADRGRGKSSALGIAAAQLMLASSKKIFITAPHISTTAQVFQHAKRLLLEYIDGESEAKNQLSVNNSKLTFKPLDKLISDGEKADLLLIDEAAAVPIDILLQLTKLFSRIVFSTTIHGYEGSGRGFEIRFQQRLAELKPEYKTIHLNEPIRWHEKDVLERFWFNTLCYRHTQIDVPLVSNKPIICRELTKTELTTSTDVLRCLFSLLIDAHYQTSPDDIQRLLDAPESKCFVITQERNILGVAQINEEGGEKLNTLTADITAGQRRVKGHLVAQNIAMLYNQITFCTLPQWRITRIAIQPQLQGNGLGTQLLTYIEKQAKHHKVAMLTTAFGCNTTLLKFWHRAKFDIIKLSNKVEVSSGENNCIFASSLNNKAKTTLDYIKREFHQESLYQVDKAWQIIPSTLLADILAISIDRECLTAQQIEMVKQFCLGQRPFISIQRVSRMFVFAHIAKVSKMSIYDRGLLIAIILQNQPYKQVSDEYNLTGKKQIEKTLKSILTQLLT